MITERFKPVLWVGGAAFAAAGLYLISLQVATEHKRLEAINLKIQATQHEIGQLNTEFITRANERQLEKWNSSDLALTTPRAGQFLASAADLDHLDVKSLNGKYEAPTAAMAMVTSDAIQTALRARAADTSTKPASTAASQPIVSGATTTRTAVIRTAANHPAAHSVPVHAASAHATSTHPTPTHLAANRGVLLEQALALATGTRGKP